ncbi:MAG: hypothetical protein WCW32_02685 [Candidatus Paceibacterota bacterium]|jgi:phospho-N-acetylmuramoyl-pentapeptide-transferase
MTLFTFNAIKIFVSATTATVFAVVWCPLLINYLYRYKLWKKEARVKAISGEDAPIFHNLHKDKEVSVPRFGGLLIWVTALFVVFLFHFLAQIFGGKLFEHLDILSRRETWLPLFTLIVASIVGFADDILQVFGRGKYVGGGMSFKSRLAIVVLIGLIGGWWFYYKLGVDTIHIPLMGDFSIGLFIIPLFILVMLACWSGGIIDGLDGLAGGVFMAIFGAFTVISFSVGMINLAAFCAVIFGTLLTFLWFNIPPARFYMGETGMLGLTSVLAVVAFLTNSVIVLPIIAGLLVIESGSVIIQLISKKLRKKKVFLSSPIHHHFEALGWPAYKVTMRFWVIGIILAIIGVAIRLLG